MASNKVAVVILNWNGKPFLERFLPFITENLPDYASIWIIDNASEDDSVAFLKDHYPEVNIVVNAQNRGYAGGYNDGLQHIEATYFVLLNSDVEVPPGWLGPVIRFMDDNPQVAACQPKILSYDRREYFEYAGASGGFIDKFGYPFCRGRIFDTLEQDKGQYDTQIPVFWTTGACMFVRSDVFYSMGGFDDTFFAHMEEIDLCWRMQNAGYRLYCNPDSVVYHVGGGSLPKEHPGKTYLNYRNNLIMLAKNLKARQVAFIIPVRLVLDGLSALQALFNGKFSIFSAIIKAHFAFYNRITGIRKYRKHKANFKRIQDMKGVYNGSIVLNYFMKGKRYYSDLD